MQKYIIIPDLHGEYNKLIFLLKQYVDIVDDIIQENDFKIIQLGDFIDKGNEKEQIQLIKFLYKNLNKMILIRGNHERSTINRLNDNSIKMTNHYDTYKILENNLELKNMFLEIVSKQNLLYEDNLIVCTHSPCLDQHILNKTNECIQFRYKRETEFKTKESYKEHCLNHFKNIINNKYDKYHFFGHLEVEDVVNVNKQFWIDTNVKNKLTIAIIEDNNITFHNSKDEFNIVVKENILNYLINKLT